MELNLKLKLEDDTKKKERVKKATNKKIKYIPTWDEVWNDGYTTHTGTVKKSIFQSKLTEPDRLKLIQVKDAIENGEIGSGVEDLSKFSKSHALNIYKALQEMRREGIIKKMVEQMPDNYQCITELYQMYALCNLLDKEEYLAIDTETTGVDIWGDSVIVGISLTLPKADYHCYIPVRHNLPDKQLKPEAVFSILKPFFEDENLKKILFNAKFDMHMLKKEDIDVKGLWMDVMVAMHLLNENEPSYALKNLATKYGEHFGFEDKSATYEELFGKGGFENTPLDIGTVYACKDTHLTYAFSQWIMSYFNKMPKLHDLYFNVELPITNVCYDMEQKGFAIDLQFAEEYAEELRGKIKVLEDKIAEGFGDININSNQQLGNIIYNVWGIEDKYKSKVDAPTLKDIYKNELSNNENVKYIGDLLEYRGLNKLLTTYIEPLPQKVCKRDNRLHGSFNQSATATGRFASNNPNLQNLPYDARKLIVAPEGKVIIGIDYSQIEPRVLSHMASDDKLKEPYITGRDLYSALASEVFKQPLEECGDGSKWRKLSKVVLLATMYGTSTFTLSQQVGITQEEAQKVIDDFFASYEDVSNFIKGTHLKADTEGYVETMFGRKRRFIGHPHIAKRFKALDKKIREQLKLKPDEDFNIWQTKLNRDLKNDYWQLKKEYGRASRQSVNAIIQGSSADIMKIAMVEVNKHLKTLGDDFKMLATIHDEILIEIPEDTPDSIILEIEAIQRDAVKLSIPFKCDIEVSKRWGKGVSYKEWAKDRSII